jgi:hypothetical protein
MAIAFATLKSRLQNAVAARSGTPSDSQYEQVLRDAVADFNNAATRLKMQLVQVLPNVATYALPADFEKFVSLSALWLGETGGVLVTGSGLVPLTANFNEIVTIEGTDLRITPTPTYSLARELWYGAGHVESGTPATYAEMTEREARIILLLAQSTALGYQANSSAGAITSYSIGDESVTHANAVADLQKRADGLRAEYDAAVKKYVGTLTQTG